jgi:hypothetical protein
MTIDSSGAGPEGTGVSAFGATAGDSTIKVSGDGGKHGARAAPAPMGAAESLADGKKTPETVPSSRLVGTCAR